VAVRISSTLLKPGAFLLIGAFIFLPVSAKALVFNWSFVNNSGLPVSGSSFTSGTISGLLDNSTNTFSQDGLITATIDVATNISAPIAFDGNSVYDSGYITVSGGVVTFYNFQIYSTGDSYGLRFDNTNSNAASNYAYAGGSSIVYDEAVGGINPVTFASVSAAPAPLPILGLPAVLFYSRKLKKRISASREMSSNALV